MEVELSRSVMEKKVLEAKLTWRVMSVVLEFEKIVICAFWESQMGEMCFGFDGLVREKVEFEKMKCVREGEIVFLKRKRDE